MRTYQSWGRYPHAEQQNVVPVYWRSNGLDLAHINGSVLPHGLGRSYGDSCLNDGGTLLDTAPLNRFIAFDEDTGLLRCEAGVMLAEILSVIVSRGWFLPTTPGTKFVTVGGAIANDVHGKNHHKAGTFGCHVTRFELLRSDGERLICSPDENAGLFRATIGGLGLTGLILWAEFRVQRVAGPFIAKEQIRFSGIDEFFEISSESDKRFEHTMAWVDCLATGKHLGRGLFMRGNYTWPRHIPRKAAEPRSLFTVPVQIPTFALNLATVKAFNGLYYRSQLSKRTFQTVPYDPFFYPLDAIHEWHRLYGEPGFLQYQFVIPFDQDRTAIKDILTQISQSGVVSFLAVLKVFGDVPSPGMLSFPRPGVTLALDFPFRGYRTLALLNRLDRVVQAHNGVLYPAKDARMSAEIFQACYPQWQEFTQYIDPKFSSSFWRRVTQVS
jgi:FAD/FMN-containing dehydrogenase